MKERRTKTHQEVMCNWTNINPKENRKYMETCVFLMWFWFFNTICASHGVVKEVMWEREEEESKSEEAHKVVVEFSEITGIVYVYLTTQLYLNVFRFTECHRHRRRRCRCRRCNGKAEHFGWISPIFQRNEMHWQNGKIVSTVNVWLTFRSHPFRSVKRHRYYQRQTDSNHLKLNMSNARTRADWLGECIKIGQQEETHDIFIYSFSLAVLSIYQQINCLLYENFEYQIKMEFGGRSHLDVYLYGKLYPSSQQWNWI